MESPFSITILAAARTGCQPEQLLKVRELPDGGAVVIAPSGQKFIYSRAELLETREMLLRQAARTPAAPEKPAEPRSRKNR